MAVEKSKSGAGAAAQSATNFCQPVMTSKYNVALIQQRIEPSENARPVPPYPFQNDRGLLRTRETKARLHAVWERAMALKAPIEPGICHFSEVQAGILADYSSGDVPQNDDGDYDDQDASKFWFCGFFWQIKKKTTKKTKKTHEHKTNKHLNTNTN
jgi:hypothetical protein